MRRGTWAQRRGHALELVQHGGALAFVVAGNGGGCLVFWGFDADGVEVGIGIWTGNGNGIRFGLGVVVDA